MKKKIVSMIMVLSMACLSACGSKNEESIVETDVASVSEETETVESTESDSTENVGYKVGSESEESDSQDIEESVEPEIVKGLPEEGFTLDLANQRFIQAIDVYQKNWINFTDEQMQDPEYMIRNEIIMCLLNNGIQTANIDSIEIFDIKTKDGVELFHKLDENDTDEMKHYQFFLRFQLFSHLMSEACEEGKDISVIDYIENHDADEILDKDQINAWFNNEMQTPAYTQFPLMYDYLMENEIDKPEAVSIEKVTNGGIDCNGHEVGYNVTFNSSLYDSYFFEGNVELTKILSFDQNGYIMN